MTIADNYLPVKYTGNGTTVDFSFTFDILNETYVKVILENIATGVQTVKTLTSDYTVVFNSLGGTITFITAPTSAYYVIIARELPLSQEVPYKTSTGFDAVRIEQSLDKLMAITQQLQDDLERVMKYPVGAGVLNIEMETPIANKGLKYNATANKIINTATDVDEAIAEATAQAVIAANQASIATAQAVIATNQAGLATTAKNAADADAAQTALDRIQTGLDAAATAADRIQTALDVIATAADRVQTGLDKTATAADRVQTGLDASATAADRVQTGLDKTACDGYATSASNSADEAASYAAQAQINTGSGTGVRVYLDDTTTVDGYGGLLKEPDIGTEVIDSAVANNNTVFIEGYLFNQAQNRTKWEAGVLELTTWGAVSSTVAGNSEIIAAGYHVIVDIGTVTVTGTGTSRTATVTGATPFVSGDANADQTLAGYVQTAGGTFQITAYTSSSVVTIATPSGYANESGVSYSLHRYLCQSSTGTLTSTSPTKYTHSIIQAGIDPVALNDRAAVRYYGKTTATNNRTISLYHNGTEHYSYIDTPFPFLHDQLPGLNATNTSYHHLSTTEYNNVVGAQTNGYSFRNKIIGGNFATNRWTKGTSLALASSTSNSSFPDNWSVSNQTDGAITVSRITGFADQSNGRYSSYACKINVDTADTSLGASQYVLFQQNIEANSITGAGFGVGGTRYINISYLLKSNVTGTLCISFINSAYDRSYVKEVSVTGSDTVQLVNFSIPVDTTGTWLTAEGTVGLRMVMTLCSGSTFQTTPNAWTAGNYLATSNQTNFLAAQNNYIAFDLVQVECGNVATPFEYRDYATEERLQDRYLPVIKPIGGLYSVIGSGQCTGTTTANVFIPFKNKSYKTPTGLVASGANHFYLYNATATPIQTSSCAFSISGQDAAMVAMEVPSGLVAGDSTICIGADNAAGIYFTGAECA